MEFDEENGTQINDQVNTNNITTFEISENNRSRWGVKDRAISPDANTTITHDALNGATFSMWILPETDFSFTISGETLSFTMADGQFSFAGPTGAILSRLGDANQWVHIAVVATSQNTGEFYVDGQSESFDSVNFAANSKTNNFQGLLDEVMIYQRSFSVSEIRYLAGRSFLDLSGNKYHAVPVGPDFMMINPDDAITDLGKLFGKADGYKQ